MPNFRQAVQLNGIPPLGLASALVAKTTTYPVTASDSVIVCNASGGAFTVTLPTAVGATGRAYTIKKTDSSALAVTVATTSSQTIDGVTTYTLSRQWQFVQVMSDGANWQIIDSVLFIDATAGDLQADGVAAAGASGLLADAKHVHPLGGLVDTSANVVTTTGPAALSKSWTLPSGLPVGATYRLTAFGHGLMAATTAVNFTFSPQLAGSTFMSTTVAAAVVAANTNFHWFATLILIVTGTGSSGTTISSSAISWGQAVAATGSNQTSPAADVSPSAAINTTTTQALQLMGGWASVTNSPTITCIGSILERVA